MTFSQEQLLRAYDSAPIQIQDALTEGSAIDFMAEISNRYKLHVDVAGNVVDAIRNMLLGLVPPSEFIPTIVAEGVGEITARSLTDDLNKEVFVPLRDVIRNGGAYHSASLTPSIPLVGVGKMEIGKVGAPALNMPSAPLHMNSSAPKIVDPVLPQSAPVQQAPVSPPAFNLVQQQSAQPVIRTMHSDMEHIKEGHYTPAEASVPLTHTMQPEHLTPARSFQTASIPVSVSPITASHPELSASPQTIDNIPLSKEYGSDPYRESV